MGSDNIDVRTASCRFHGNAAAPGRARWLGTSIASLSKVERCFVIGSFLRKDHPLFAQRLRQAARKRRAGHSLNAVHDDWAMPLAHHDDGRAEWLGRSAGAEVAAAVAAAKGVAAPAPAVTRADAAKAIAASLLGGEAQGRAARQHGGAASASVAAAGAGAVDRCAHRRHGRLPLRGRQQRRRATRRRAAARWRLRTPARC